MKTISKFQIGKAGITPGVIESLELSLKHHKQIKVSALKSSGRDKGNIKSMAQDIINKLNEKKINCDFKTIGFTIILIKKPNKPKKPNIQ